MGLLKPCLARAPLLSGFLSTEAGEKAPDRTVCLYAAGQILPLCFPVKGKDFAKIHVMPFSTLPPSVSLHPPKITSLNDRLQLTKSKRNSSRLEDPAFLRMQLTSI